MIKLYVFYLILGLYMLSQSIFIWYFRAFNDGDAMITYVALISSSVLLSVASGLLMYRPKSALIVGIIALLGVLPFGIRWLIYRYTIEAPIIRGNQNQIILVATILYAVGLFYSLKRIINYKYCNNVVVLKKPLKLFLTFFPACLLFILIVSILIDP